MKRVLVMTAAVLLTAFSVSESHACHWSECGAGCKSGYAPISKRSKPIANRPGKKCVQTWCCASEAAKKLKQDRGFMCRARCNNTGSAYNGYFQCMRNCMGKR